VKETIETLYGNDEITNRTLQVFESTQKSIEGIIGKDEIAMHVSHDWHMNGLSKLREKGVQIRVVTQITSENLSFCKIYSQAVELRHLEGIQSSFGISDGIWLLDHVVSLDEFPLSHAILTNVKKLVDVKRSLFETMWRQSIPAEEAIADLEKSNPEELINQLNPQLARERLFNLITNSKYHADIIIPNEISLKLLTAEGFIDYLNAAAKQGVRIRILLPYVEVDPQPNLNATIELKRIENIQSKKIILLIDNIHSLAIEIKQDMGGSNDLISIIKNAVYRSSSVGLMALSALFEKMWT